MAEKNFVNRVIPKPDPRLVELALVALAQTLKQNAQAKKPKKKKG